MNSNGQVQWIGGPHHPTEDDGDLTLYYSKKIAKTFLLIMIIANCHFTKATLFLKKVKLITPKSNAERPKMVKGKKVLHQLIEEEERVNEISLECKERSKHYTVRLIVILKDYKNLFMKIRLNMTVWCNMPLQSITS